MRHPRDEEQKGHSTTLSQIATVNVSPNGHLDIDHGDNSDDDSDGYDSDGYDSDDYNGSVIVALTTIAPATIAKNVFVPQTTFAVIVMITGVQRKLSITEKERLNLIMLMIGMANGYTELPNFMNPNLGNSLDEGAETDGSDRTVMPQGATRRSR
ncbi:hypothetical protein VNI00_014210 [Paramarasmius palmivorus]|uniref:Uncharacterized protein n=1 Tax=Paramarasmius palmivorus TaxID=297713 RepID=A0AAW0BWG1_9AGAR